MKLLLSGPKDTIDIGFPGFWQVEECCNSTLYDYKEFVKNIPIEDLTIEDIFEHLFSIHPDKYICNVVSTIKYFFGIATFKHNGVCIGVLNDFYNENYTYSYIYIKSDFDWEETLSRCGDLFGELDIVDMLIKENVINKDGGVYCFDPFPTTLYESFRDPGLLIYLMAANNTLGLKKKLVTEAENVSDIYNAIVPQYRYQLDWSN